MSKPILTVENLTVTFETKYGRAEAVNDISFTLEEGEKLGLVGESGSGKSVASKSIMRLLPSPPAKVKGKVFLGDKNLLDISEKEMRQYLGNKITMIFQEPMVSLNPLFTIGNQLSEVIRLHQNCTKKECYKKVIDMLKTVGIPSPETRFGQYPFELSGGMRQRVMIAMALLCKPQVLIADEPTTALDVTIQAQIMDLLKKLNEEFNVSIILITHDLGVVAEMVDTVAVMYAGSIVEKGPVRDIFYDAKHPYTQGLLKAIPTMKDVKGDLETIEGNVPSIYKLPSGCAFNNRCKYKKSICTQEVPPTTVNGERWTKCWKCNDRWG